MKVGGTEVAGNYELRKRKVFSYFLKVCLDYREVFGGTHHLGE